MHSALKLMFLEPTLKLDYILSHWSSIAVPGHCLRQLHQVKNFLRYRRETLTLLRDSSTHHAKN